MKKLLCTYFSSLSRFSRISKEFLINIIVFQIYSAAFVKITYELEFGLQTASDGDTKSQMTTTIIHFSILNQKYINRDGILQVSSMNY